jgi:hypothetical protein
MAIAADYLREFEAKMQEYDRLVDEYSVQYDDFTGSLFRDGAFLPSTGAMGAQINRPNSLFQSGGFTGVVRQDDSRNRVFAQSGQMRQADSIRKIDSMVGFGGTGQFQETFRDPVSGLTFDITNRNTKLGVEFAPNTFGFQGGTVIGLSPEPEFTAEPPTFDSNYFQTLLDKPLTDYENELQRQEDENEALRNRNIASQAKFDEELAQFQEESKKQLSVLEKETQETENRLDAIRQTIDQEEEEKLRRSGAERAGYVRARRLRGQPILGGNE